MRFARFRITGTWSSSLTMTRVISVCSLADSDAHETLACSSAQCGSGAHRPGLVHIISGAGRGAFFDGLSVCRSVERNALRANLVTWAEDWRWGSLWHWHQGTAAM
jgi:hypothetical protein